MHGLIRTGYQLRFEPIAAGDESLGQIGVLPWDTETFQFAVATYRPGAPELEPEAQRRLEKEFARWVQANGVLLCSCAVPANSTFWKSFLPTLNFYVVDVGLKASLNGLQSATLPEARAELRKAAPEDREQIEQIAGTAFQHGRYHADSRFPRRLADLRYRDWMKRALSGEQSRDQIYVMGEPGNLAGFYHVTIDDNVSDLRLAAVSRELQGTMLGFELYVAILQVLKQAGVRKVVTSMSPTNTGVLNVYSALGFRFSEPEMIYHWHVEGALPE